MIILIRRRYKVAHNLYRLREFVTFDSVDSADIWIDADKVENGYR